MPGYFGTEQQQRLQAQAEAAAADIAATPGACQAGRIMACDDVEKLGLKQIDDILARDGICGFRLIASESLPGLADRLAERGCRLDQWDVFTADRSTALAACNTILSRGLPEGLKLLPAPTEPEDAYTRAIQSLMAASGIAPFSGSMLTGVLGPAVTVALGKSETDIAAAAHGYMPHNAHSPFHAYAWGGLVAVSESHRGQGLGANINAALIAAIFRTLSATHVYELIAPTNIPSRRMAQSCGLTHAKHLTCAMAVKDGGEKFTR